MLEVAYNAQPRLLWDVDPSTCTPCPKLLLCACAQGVSHRHLSDHLSDLVEQTLSDLEASKVTE